MIAAMLVESPRMYPGTCCDGSQPKQGEQVVDTQYEIYEQYRIYLSKRQVVEYGRLFGMAERSDVERAEERAITAEARVLELETELADAQPILAAVARANQRYGVEDD